MQMLGTLNCERSSAMPVNPPTLTLRSALYCELGLTLRTLSGNLLGKKSKRYLQIVCRGSQLNTFVCEGDINFKSMDENFAHLAVFHLGGGEGAFPPPPPR